MDVGRYVELPREVTERTRDTRSTHDNTILSEKTVKTRARSQRGRVEDEWEVWLEDSGRAEVFVEGGKGEISYKSSVDNKV